MKNKILIYFLMIFLLMTSVLAFTEYENVGKNDFKSDTTSYFNSALGYEDIITYNKPVSSPRLSPLVSDLDGDGIKEIIVADGSQIKIYQNLSLDSVDAFDISSTITSFIVYNLSGNGNKIIVGGNSKLSILELNETISEVQSITTPKNNPIVNCFEDECFAVSYSTSNFSATSLNLFVF